MEKATAGARAGDRRVALGRCAAFAAGCSLLSLSWAQGPGPSPSQDVIVAEARTDKQMHLELNTSTLPRLDSQDSGFQAPRVDVSLLPPGGSGLGVAVGMSTSPSRVTLLPAGYAAIRPSVDLGLTWRHTLHRQQQIDVTAWRRMPTEQDAYTLVQMREPVYGARVEMKLSSARKAGFNVERGFIGMQLESGAKISVKRKDGRPMVYYRTAF